MISGIIIASVLVISFLDLLSKPVQEIFDQSCSTAYATYKDD